MFIYMSVKQLFLTREQLNELTFPFKLHEMAPPKHFTLVSKYFLIDVCVHLDVSLLVLLSPSLSKLLKYFDA